MFIRKLALAVNMTKVLVVEDDQAVSEAILDSLEQLNLTVELVENGIEGAERLRIYYYDLVILDLHLPGKTGMDICREYRAGGGVIPILMLTASSSKSAIVNGLQSGADDYLTKPFSMDELNARVAALLRRPRAQVPDIITLGDLAFDQTNQKVTRAGCEISLLPKELALLQFFMRHPNQTFSVADLLNRVWSSESDSSDEAVWQSIARLRRKIDNQHGESFIVTVKGMGYKISEPDV
jgi:DNA-binding response OmpR family regulator